MKLLAIIAPLALAATIPPVPEDWPKSLDVRAQLKSWTTLDITIENKSPKAFNILKAGSVLDNNRLESMRIAGGGQGCNVGLLNSYKKPHTDPRDESEFQLMPANGNITITIDLLDMRTANRFCGNRTSILWIDGTFYAAEAGGTTIVSSIPYKLDYALIYPEFFPPLPEAFEERVHKCSPDYLSVLKEGILGCASQAAAAREAALNGSAERMEAYFKDSSQETRSSVADTFAKVAAECNFKNSRLYITCNHTLCRNSFASIFTGSDPGHMIFCKRAYFQPTFPDLNELSSVIHTVIHEMTHLSWVKATEDKAYGLYHSTNLGKDESIMNADSYALFSDAVYLNQNGLNKTTLDNDRERIENMSYDSNKLGDITRSEFLSLAPAVRSERFGFEL